jgi:hypothetical protein
MFNVNMSLSAEQHRALTFLTTAAVNGATQSLLAAHDFSGAIISGMVNRGLATPSFERFRAGGRMIKVRMVRITTPGGTLLLSISDARRRCERSENRPDWASPRDRWHLPARRRDKEVRPSRSRSGVVRNPSQFRLRHCKGVRWATDLQSSPGGGWMSTNGRFDKAREGCYWR